MTGPIILGTKILEFDVGSDSEQKVITATRSKK